MTSDALRYAARLHEGQRRDLDAASFIVHPLEVAALLHNSGEPDEVVAAGVLHDVVEDTDATVAELERRYGARVAALVAALTEDESIESYPARKQALRDQVRAAGPEAGAVYAADKVAKVRELRARLACAAQDGRLAQDGRPEPVDAHRGPATAQRLEHYWESLRMLEQLIPGRPLVRQLRFELEILQAIPPGGGTPPQLAAKAPAGP